VLAGLSEGRFGRRVVFVDVGLCAIFGGFTVLATKAISTLLALEWWDMFTEWITYPVIAVSLISPVSYSVQIERIIFPGARADRRRPNSIPESCIKAIRQ